MTDNRFMRTALLLGNEGLKKLQSATVAVVGLGAVGGYALEALARAGIGHLILVDFDRFDITNINRQILALDTTIGLKKTDVAKERVQNINPDCVVEIKDTFVDAENLDEIFNTHIDFAVDAIDSIKEKCEMMAFLAAQKIPFVSAMGAALKTDIAALKIVKLSQTLYCPMAKKIRKNLKERGIDITNVKCVASFEQTTAIDKPLIAGQNGAKAVLGSMSTVTAVMGLMLAHEVILSLAKGK